MTTTTEALRARLLAHAGIHDADLAHDEEQRQWAADLREAAAALSAIDQAPSVEPVAWAYVPSDVWRDTIITQDPEQAAEARRLGRVVTPLYATPQAQPAELAMPAELDVRRILLRIVPGDGSGLEVYAKTVADVERTLTEMSERIEELEDRATPPAVQAPLTDEQLCKLRQADNGALNYVTLRQFRVIARATERAHGIGAAAQGGEHV